MALSLWGSGDGKADEEVGQTGDGDASAVAPQIRIPESEVGKIRFS
jgi:hypothetical protein